MGNIINRTSTQIFGLDKKEEDKKIKQKKIYPIPIRGRGDLYAFVRLMND
jgi:hypothetical protein